MAGLTRIKSDGIGDNCDFDGEGTLVLDSTNNRVGIGTSSPQQNLQINDSVTPAIRFSRDTSYYWDIGHTNSDFQFNSESGGTIMHLNFNGNVGIGTTSPSALLHLAANAPYITFEDKDNNQDWQLQATAWFALRDQTNNAERLRIDSSGRLLVGTTTEGAVNADNLTINDSGNCGLTIRSANTGSGNIYFSDSTSGTAEFAGAVLYDHNDDRMMLYSASTERLRIDSSGNVGIGTTAPGYRLDVGNGTSHNTLRVNGNANSLINITASTTGNARLEFGDSNDDDAGKIYYSNSDNAFTFATNGGAEDMRLDSSGNLQVSTGQFTVGTTATTGLQFINDGTFGTLHSANLVFRTVSTERMRIDNSGNVGIGTVPDVRFHVADTSDGSSAYIAEFENLGTANNTGCRLLLRTQTGSTNTDAYIESMGTSGGNSVLRFATENSGTLAERMRIDGSGRLLVGTTTNFDSSANIQAQGNGLALKRDITDSGVNNGLISFYSGGGLTAYIYGLNDGVQSTGDTPGALVFSTTADGASSPTERMRIHSNGQVGVGTGGTSTGGSTVDVTVRMTPATSAYGIYCSNFSSGTTSTPGGYGIYGHMGGTPPSGQAHYGLYGKVDTHSSRASGGLLAYSINNSVYGIVGYWSTAAYYGFYSNGSVYAAGGFSSSDSRLKDIVSDGIGTGILDKVCNLQAKRFTWKDNTLQRRGCEDVLIGLLAQDVQTDFPEVVTSVHQTKITGVNPETLNEQLGDNLAIDYGKLVPVLVEALKEAKTRIETLEAEVAALKSN